MSVVLLGVSGGGPLAAVLLPAGVACGRETHRQVSCRAPDQAECDKDAATRWRHLGVLPLGSEESLNELHRPVGARLKNDPLAIDESLLRSIQHMVFAHRRSPPSYSPDFLARYRNAQRERVARIDASALQIVERRSAAKRNMRAASRDP